MSRTLQRWRTSSARSRLAERASRVVAWIHDVRYADPTQRAAIDHVHDDLQRMEERIQRYRSAAEAVRHQARRELQQRIERARPGNTSPAVVATLTILGTTITLILTFVVGLLNGWFVLAAAATDPNTGLTHGVTQSQATTMLGGTGTVLLVAGVALVVIAYFVVSGARDRDRDRATHQVWLDTYAEVEERLVASQRSARGRARRGGSRPATARGSARS